jgi:hypothetical protein
MKDQNRNNCGYETKRDALLDAGHGTIPDCAAPVRGRGRATLLFDETLGQNATT